MVSVNIQSSILISGNVKIYFDPIKMEKKYDADYIFITHSHYDHFSKEDILNIKNDNTVIVCPDDVYDECLEMGFTKENVYNVAPFDEYDFGVISFKTVPAYNVSKPFHPKENNWLGYVLYFEGMTYYIAGDTDGLDENLNISADMAFIPIGGTYTMDALEAARFVNKLKPNVVVPIHYGMVVGNEKDLDNFIENVDSDIKVNVFLRGQYVVVEDKN